MNPKIAVIYGVISSSPSLCFSSLMKKRPIALLEYSSEDDAEETTSLATHDQLDINMTKENDTEIAPEELDQLPEEVREFAKQLVYAERSLGEVAKSADRYQVTEISNLEIEAAINRLNSESLTRDEDDI